MNKEIQDSMDMWSKDYPIVTIDNGNGAAEFNIFLQTGINEPATFNEVMTMLFSALPEDTIVFHINSPGGWLDSATMLINAIVNCKAVVIAKLSGTVASAATMIALACDNVIVAPYTTFMIHNFSFGVAGKGHEMRASIKANVKINAKFYRDIYKEFLTPEEISSVLEGKDIYLSAKQTRKRFSKVLKARDKIINKATSKLEKVQEQEVKMYLEEKGYTVQKV